MVQNETNLVVADNSGATSVRVFRRLGGSFRRNATVGDVVICAVKSAIPNGKVKKSDVVKGVIVRVKKAYQRRDGSTIKFDDNAVVHQNVYAEGHWYLYILVVNRDRYFCSYIQSVGL